MPISPAKIIDRLNWSQRRYRYLYTFAHDLDFASEPNQTWTTWWGETNRGYQLRDRDAAEAILVENIRPGVLRFRLWRMASGICYYGPAPDFHEAMAEAAREAYVVCGPLVRDHAFSVGLVTGDAVEMNRIFSWKLSGAGVWEAYDGPLLPWLKGAMLHTPGGDEPVPVAGY